MSENYNNNQNPNDQRNEGPYPYPQQPQGGYVQQNQGYNQQYQGPYQGNGQQYYQNPPPYYGPPPQYRDPNDAPSFGFALLGFFIPVVGLILFLVWKDQSPLKAKSAGKGALASVIVWIGLIVLMTVLAVIFGGMVYNFYGFY
jgi:hypothetical protein